MATMRVMPVAASVVLFATALVVAGAEPRSLLLVYLAAVTPELWRMDLAQHRLPNRIVLPGYVVGLVAVVTQWWVSGDSPLTALTSAVGYGGFLMVLSVTGGMGMGDVKLAGVLGLAAGLVSPGAALASPVIAFVAGGAGAVVQLIRAGPRTSIPFGPYLLAGFWVAVVLSPGGSST